MTTQLEDLIRDTLAKHAPATVRSADWAALRARANRRTATGRATVITGAAAVGAIAVTTAWGSNPSAFEPSTVLPSATAEPMRPTSSAAPTVHITPAQPVLEQPVVPVAPGVLATALSFVRSSDTAWSTGPASEETIELALGTLMASELVTDDAAQPQVLWSSEGHAKDTAQGPQAMVAVEQQSGWVVGYWSQRRDLAVTLMTFGTMPGGPIVDRFVGFAIEGDDLGIESARHIVYVAPVGATRVVEVMDAAAAEYPGVAPGTETEIENGYGNYAFSPPPTIRAYAADGSLLAEMIFE